MVFCVMVRTKSVSLYFGGQPWRHVVSSRRKLGRDFSAQDYPAVVMTRMVSHPCHTRVTPSLMSSLDVFYSCHSVVACRSADRSESLVACIKSHRLGEHDNGAATAAARP